MFSEFFKLSVNPFSETPNTRFFYRGDSHVAALDQILGSIRNGKGFSLLTGEVGVGKTLLSRMLLNYLQKLTPTALVLNPILNTSELLSAIREEFNLPQPTHLSVKSEYDQLSKFLIETASAKKRAVLIIDEAQRLTFEGFEAVRLLSNLETEDRKLLQIILIGQPELKAKLEQFDLRQLNQRIAIRTEIKPLNAPEVDLYIRARIEKAGGSCFIRFEERATALVAKQSGGVPRLINFYCERILSLAEQEKTRLVDVALIERALSIKQTQVTKPSKFKWRFWDLRNRGLET